MFWATHKQFKLLYFPTFGSIKDKAQVSAGMFVKINDFSFWAQITMINDSFYLQQIDKSDCEEMKRDGGITLIRSDCSTIGIFCRFWHYNDSDS